MDRYGYGPSTSPPWKPLTDEQKDAMIQISSKLVSASNMMFDHHENRFKDMRELELSAFNMFREHFPDRPEDDIFEIQRCCRSIFAGMTKTPVHATYTGTREMWGHLLYGKEYEKMK